MAVTPNHDEAVAMERRLSVQKEKDYEMTQETSTGEALDVELDPAMEQKLLMKLDLAFVPIIMLTYLSCFLDRSNIGTSHQQSQQTKT
jgi:hypothetical protein